MANNQETKKKGSFEFLEKKIVFLFSRIFFWIVCIVAGVVFVVSLILFLYNIFPPIKESVAKAKLPPEVTISSAEIETAIAPPPAKPKEEKPVEVVKPTEKVTPKEKEMPTPPPPDPLELALKAKIDTLKLYFPENQYTWATISERIVVERDLWGNPARWGTRIKVYGLDRQLNKVLNLYDETKKKIDVVKELLSIIPQIDIKNRGKALEAYAAIRVKREKERKNEIREIESEVEYKRSIADAKYIEAKAKKAVGVAKSLRALGASFVGIAIIGLFLCFLAIERNTRAVQEMIEKRG